VNYVHFSCTNSSPEEGFRSQPPTDVISREHATVLPLRSTLVKFFSHNNNTNMDLALHDLESNREGGLWLAWKNIQVTSIDGKKVLLQDVAGEVRGKLLGI
jgi:hypothetical protein